LPRFLNPGDEVALIAPSGCQHPEKLEKAVESVRRFGLKPRVYPTCTKKYGYLAGMDVERARG
jgi:muramoyltetrapeptide carboxypeptidase